MITVAAFYRFTPLPDPQGLKAPLARAACAAGVRGTILLAEEGVNGTIAGPPEAVAAAMEAVRALPGCGDIAPVTGPAAAMPFDRLKVRVRPEIVTFGHAGADPAARTGTHVAPRDWNALIAAPDVAVIDTRNDYEVAIGTFEGAEDPGTESFGAFTAWWDANRERLSGKRLAMFCTGGIRCEKATSWLLSQGVAEVYQLRGGILSYLAETPPGESLWRGECFVFDDRVSVGHGLARGRALMCHGCRRPLMPEDRMRPGYEEGVSCHRCAPVTTAEDKARYRERHRQRQRARARGEA